MSTAAQKEPIVLKQTSGYWIPIVIWAFCAYLLGDAIVRGAWSIVLSSAPWLLLVASVVYGLLWRPALLAGRETAVIRNPVFSYSMAYADIVDVRLGANVGIYVPDETGRDRLIRSWNAPGRRRPHGPKEPTNLDSQMSAMADARRGAPPHMGGSGSDSFVLKERWESSEPRSPRQPAVRSLNAPVVLVVLIFAAWSLASVLV